MPSGGRIAPTDDIPFFQGQRRALTTFPQGQIRKDLDRDYYMSAKDGVKYGLIDRVLELGSDTQL